MIIFLLIVLGVLIFLILLQLRKVNNFLIILRDTCNFAPLYQHLNAILHHVFSIKEMIENKTVPENNQEQFREFKIGDFDMLLMRETLNKNKNENVIIWKSLGLEVNLESVITDDNGKKYYTSKRPKLIEDLREEELVKSFNQILRIPDLFKIVDVNLYKQRLSEEAYRLLAKALNSNNLSEQEYMKLNKDLLHQIYQVNDGLLKWPEKSVDL